MTGSRISYVVGGLRRLSCEMSYAVDTSGVDK